MGAGFGDPCELCPEKGTKEFEYYCPNGVGLTRNNTGNLMPEFFASRNLRAKSFILKKLNFVATNCNFLIYLVSGHESCCHENNFVLTAIPLWLFVLK